MITHFYKNNVLILKLHYVVLAFEFEKFSIHHYIINANILNHFSQRLHFFKKLGFDVV